MKLTKNTAPKCFCDFPDFRNKLCGTQHLDVGTEAHNFAHEHFVVGEASEAPIAVAVLAFYHVFDAQPLFHLGKDAWLERNGDVRSRRLSFVEIGEPTVKGAGRKFFLRFRTAENAVELEKSEILSEPAKGVDVPLPVSQIETQRLNPAFPILPSAA